MDIAKVWLSSLIVLVVAILAVIYARSSQAAMLVNQPAITISIQSLPHSENCKPLKLKLKLN